MSYYLNLNVVFRYDYIVTYLAIIFFVNWILSIFHLNVCPTSNLIYNAIVTFRNPKISRRVEDGRGDMRTQGVAVTGSFRFRPVPQSGPSLRFPSPLIKPCMRISRIRLSDCLHLKAHGVWLTCSAFALR